MAGTGAVAVVADETEGSFRITDGTSGLGRISATSSSI
jgi:hypothetical protein